LDNIFLIPQLIYLHWQRLLLFLQNAISTNFQNKLTKTQRQNFPCLRPHKPAFGEYDYRDQRQSKLFRKRYLLFSLPLLVLRLL
jgi:hypothetical protein